MNNTIDLWPIISVLPTVVTTGWPQPPLNTCTYNKRPPLNITIELTTSLRSIIYMYDTLPTVSTTCTIAQNVYPTSILLITLRANDVSTHHDRCALQLVPINVLMVMFRVGGENSQPLSNECVIDVDILRGVCVTQAYRQNLLLKKERKHPKQ